MNATQRSRVLDAHRTALAGCRRCGFGSEITPIVSRASRPHAMLIGQAPGKVEADSGKPFSGRAGRTLFGWLERAGIDELTARDRIYISAVTRCYPGAHPSGRGDRVPSREEQLSCSAWLESELRIIQPKLVIPVGRLAIERFLPKLPLALLIGTKRMVEHAGGRSVVIPLPHPSGASSWIHETGHRNLLDSALHLIALELGSLVAAPTGALPATKNFRVDHADPAPHR